MLRLEKIYIENFKGIATKKIIEFGSSDLSILNGPNGFGKTTIFDAIELCLRGKLERTVQFSNIQKNNQNYKKPFYQNIIGKDVVIKVLFRDSNTSIPHIFIKYLDKDHTGKIGNSKSFRPDAWGILETYYSNDEQNFGDYLDKASVQLVDQEQIDLLFFNEPDLSLQNLYPLFNYLQQEENIYFLKKDEEEKKEELNFLFQTQQQANELDKLTFLLKGIKSVKDDLGEKIELLGETAKNGENQLHLKLFVEREIAYDQVEPFLNHSTANLSIIYEAYTKDLDILEQFSNSFDLEEYNKDKLREAIAFAVNNVNILSAFVLQDFCTTENYERLEKLDTRRLRYSNNDKSLESNRFEDSVLEDLNFDHIFIAAYKAAILERNNQEQAIGEIGKIINDLIIARSEAIDKAAQLNSTIHQPHHCPLCDFDWNNIEALQNAISLKTESLINFNSVQLTRLEELNRALKNNYQSLVQQRIRDFLASPENQLDIGFFGQVREFRGFGDRIKRFQAIIGQGGISFDEFILRSTISETQLQEHVGRLKVQMTNSLSNIIPDQEKLLHKHLFKDLFSENELLLVSISEVQNKRNYVEFKYNEARMFSLNILNERFESFKILESNITKIKNALDQSIKRYKVEMIEKIKIPFYLYSGKILQNYQQGLGIFIDMQGNTNRVRFLTDNESDHDIIHHLSSGQLAVVSIAFCLALNKVYETTNHFKFLAIDDPVQTLDDINIHSFIELMRHDFKDYQIIMSTHEDDIANYLSYKFEKFDFKCNRLKVQQIFYANNE